MTAISDRVSGQAMGDLPNVGEGTVTGEAAVQSAVDSTYLGTTGQGEGRKIMTIAVSYILISVCAGAIGQLLLKHGMNQNGVVTLELGGITNLLLRLVLNPFVMGGLFLYACGTLFWLAGISRVDLSFAYPFASLSYVIMLIASWQLFDENISWIRLSGTALIALGVFVISRS